MPLILVELELWAGKKGTGTLGGAAAAPPLPSESEVLALPGGDGFLLGRAFRFFLIFVILFNPGGSVWPPGCIGTMIGSGGFSGSDLFPSDLFSSLFDPLPPLLLWPRPFQLPLQLELPRPLPVPLPRPLWN